MWLLCITASAAEPPPDARPLLTQPGRLLFTEGFNQVPHERIDAKHFAFGSGERIDVDKTSVQFRVRGESVALKNLRVWEATRADTCEAMKAKLLAERKAN